MPVEVRGREVDVVAPRRAGPPSRRGRGRGAEHGAGLLAPAEVGEVARDAAAAPRRTTCPGPSTTPFRRRRGAPRRRAAPSRAGARRARSPWPRTSSAAGRPRTCRSRRPRRPGFAAGGRRRSRCRRTTMPGRTRSSSGHTVPVTCRCQSRVTTSVTPRSTAARSRTSYRAKRGPTRNASRATTTAAITTRPRTTTRTIRRMRRRRAGSRGAAAGGGAQPGAVCCQVGGPADGAPCR